MRKLSGQAWESCETLDLSSLRRPDGVQALLSHLWAELEPLEHLRIANTLTEFYQKFKRPKHQQFTTFDSHFRAQCQRLKECGAPLAGTSLAFWFLDKANLSEDLRRQVLSAAGGEYDYNKLRQALVAIVPRVQEEERSDKRWFKRNPDKSNRVHAVDQEATADEEPPGDLGAEDEGGDEDEEHLEQVLMTSAAKKRSAADKNRGFHREETDEARARRIKDMKARMPCAACKSRGFTRYGHWHEDKTCPFYQESKSKTKPVFIVDQEEPSEDSDDAYVVHVTTQEDTAQLEEHMVSSVVLAAAGHLRSATDGMALADTCCARTVCGSQWMENHLAKLAKLGAPYMITEDSQPFRFGDGPCVRAYCGSDFSFVARILKENRVSQSQRDRARCAAADLFEGSSISGSSCGLRAGGVPIPHVGY